LNEKIFNYCERALDPGLTAEPLNAVTNTAFLIAGFAALYLIRQRPPHERSIAHLTLAFLIILIGIGSFLFHTHATVWAAITDVTFIGMFMLLYFGVALRSLLRLSTAWTLLLTLAFAASLGVAAQLTCSADGMFVFGGAGRPCLNGSLAYLPPLLAILAMGVMMAREQHPAAGALLFAGAIFAASVTLRTLDQDFCPETVIAGYRLGTHFVWHVLNAIMLFILMRALVTDARCDRR
jgi:membrane-associated HD superfamily phosphohydrolase